jgi:hypothetical protein
MSGQLTFGYISVWAKGTLKTLTEEYEIEDGIIASGKIQVTKEQADELVTYLENADYGKYGTTLDVALFYNEDKSVKIGGSIKSPYTPGDTSGSSTTAKKQSKAAGAKRKL